MLSVNSPRNILWPRASVGRMAELPPRISSLDALRGVAVLGILLVNIPSFAFVAAARANPTVQGPLDGAHWWMWLLTYVMFDGKFISMFAISFGASIVLLVDRRARRNAPAASIHIRRMVILLAIGLLHAHLLWYGDWLVTLAVSGAVAFLYRDVSPGRLLAAGVVVYAVGELSALVTAGWAPWQVSDRTAEIAASWAPSTDAVAREVGRYRSSWLDQLGHRIPTALRYETVHLVTRSLWQMTGLMLVGMALLRLGVLTAVRTTRFYAAMAAVGFAVGAPLVLFGVRWNIAHGWDVGSYLAVTSHCNYWGGFIMSLGWIGSVMLLVRRGVEMRAMAAVGRLALTNYLLQSVICTTIFYGHGFGLFGHIGRVGLVGIVMGVWAVQVALSVGWLRYFEFGPVEWAWRCLTYGRRLPIRRDPGAVLAQA